MPPFVADSVGMAVRDGLSLYGERLFHGDVLICNHASVQGQHLNNTVMYAPVFVGAHKDTLVGFFAINMHWVDIGGMSTGFGAGPTVADPWQEGLQLDQIKIYDGGVLDETIYRVIKDNIRFPESSLGDMKSQMAACRLGNKRLDELFTKYGKDTVLACIAQIFDGIFSTAKIRNTDSGTVSIAHNDRQVFCCRKGLVISQYLPVLRINFNSTFGTIGVGGCDGICCYREALTRSH